jgi:hypothetical protein
MPTQVSPRDFAVGLPTATGQPPPLPITSLSHPFGYHAGGVAALQGSFQIRLTQGQERLADVDAVAYRNSKEIKSKEVMENTSGAG